MSRTKGRKATLTVALPSPLPPLLTRPQVCALVHLSYVSIWKMVKQGRFPAAINIAPTTGVRNRWATSEVLAWWEQQKSTGRRQPFAQQAAAE